MEERRRVPRHQVGEEFANSASEHERSGAGHQYRRSASAVSSAAQSRITRQPALHARGGTVPG